MDFNNKLKPQRAKPKWDTKYRQPLRDFLLQDEHFRKKASSFGGKQEMDDKEYATILDSFLDYSEHDGLMDYYLTDVEDKGGSWVKMPDGTYVNLDDLYDDFNLG